MRIDSSVVGRFHVELKNNWFERQKGHKKIGGFHIWARLNRTFERRTLEKDAKNPLKMTPYAKSNRPTQILLYAEESYETRQVLNVGSVDDKEA